MTTIIRNDFGRLITTEVIDGKDHDYYLDDDTKEIMILVDVRPLFDKPKTPSEVLLYFANKIAKLRI